MDSDRFSKFVWMAHRLAAMSPMEVAHRFKEQSAKRNGKKLGGWNAYLRPDVQLAHLPFDSKAFDRLAGQLMPDWRGVYDAARNGAWSYLGVNWPGKIGDDVWHLDPVTGTTWPSDTYCFDVPFRHMKGMGDIKYVWEVNRLQFLPPIAALARAENDPEIAAYCLATIESWIDANPPFLGINWTSGIELSLRAISIILTVSLLDPKDIPAKTAAKIMAALHAHAVWLMRFPSRFSSANNHLIAEATGLYIIGRCAPDLPNATRYQAYGLQTLTEEAHKQILGDGVGAEQSPTYTAFTLELYLMALAVAKAHDDEVPQSITKQLRNAGKFLSWITDTAGNQPRIGDDDEGRVITSAVETETGYASAIMKGLAAVTGDPALAPPVVQPHLRDLFMGNAAASTDHPVGWQTFDEGGYSVFRLQMAGHDTMLVFDHGPLGYLSIAAHGHADALAVWLHVDEQPVLIDAGTYLYHAGGEDRSYFRGTNAHNTLCLNGEDQSTISGPFNWSHKAKAKRLPMKQTANGLCSVAQHDGYKKRFGLVHERTVALDVPDGYAITDRLLGTPKIADATATIRYILAPDLRAEKSGDQVTLSRDGVALAVVEIFKHQGAAEQALPIQIGEQATSSRFGVVEKTNTISIDIPAAEICQNGALNTRIRFIRAEDK